MTVKLTVKFADMPLLPLTVTVAVYVPTASPVRGTTEKFAVEFTVRLGMLAPDKLKAVEFAPDKATLIVPVV